MVEAWNNYIKMKLNTFNQFDNIIFEQSSDNNNSIITNKVRITAKYKQRAQNKKETIENTYNSSIDKGIKKRNFFNKHKNN